MFQKNKYEKQLTIGNYLPRFNTFQNLIPLSTKWNLFKKCENWKFNYQLFKSFESEDKMIGLKQNLLRMEHLQWRKKPQKVYETC